MASGDDMLQKEARDVLGNIETAVVKTAINRWSARCLSMERSNQEITSKAKNAVQRIEHYSTYKIGCPVVFDIESYSTGEFTQGSVILRSYVRPTRVMAYQATTIYVAWIWIHACLN